MHKLALLALICALMPSQLFAQTDTTDAGFLRGATVPGKMLAAKHEFNENNMRGALILYREVLATDPTNANALYWTARCHYALKRYDLAEEYLGKALNVDEKVGEDIDFHYGMINHRIGELDKAIRYFERYLESGNKKGFEYGLAQSYIEQCRFAKEAMAHPVDVKIDNMGRLVNSRFDEYTPSITADGSMMVFTSRRSGKEGGEIDEGGDYKFFEDIYVTFWKEDKASWSSAFQLEGDVNTSAYDAVLSISPSGREMFIYKNNRESAGDIFHSEYDKYNEEWKFPVKLDKPVNTSYYEGSCSVTSDGGTLYFVSERPGGNGRGDIYVSQKRGEGWSTPVNIGKVINTKEDEKFVWIHPNGKTLYFASDGHPGLGSYDIYKSEYVNGEWGIPINLGYPINTVNEESTFSLTRDNNSMLVAAEYEDSFGERDIYQIDVSAYPLISSGYDRSGFGSIVCTVKDAKGKPVSRQKVEFLSTYNDRVLFEEKTGKDGRVSASLPGNASYRVRVQTREGWVEQEIRLELQEKGETVQNVVLKI